MLTGGGVGGCGGGGSNVKYILLFKKCIKQIMVSLVCVLGLCAQVWQPCDCQF